MTFLDPVHNEILLRLLAWAQHGPSTARVEKIDTRWRSYTGEFSEFRIVSDG